MASGIQSKRKALTEEILRLGNAIDESSDSPQRVAQNCTALNQLLEKTSTLILLPILTALVQPGRCQELLRFRLTQTLSLLPLRSQGVRNTIEFILAIHPSTAAAGNAKDSATSRGANVSLEALNSAAKLISSPPSGMSPQHWFDGIGPQLMELLDGSGGLEMIKAASYIIGYGILGRREYGAPGKAGWKVFAEPLLHSINPSLGGARILENVFSHERVIDLSRPEVLISGSQLMESLRRLATLVSSHPNPALSRRLIGNLLLPLWTLFSWPARGVEYEAWRAPAGYLLQIYLELAENTKLKYIMNALMINGGIAGDRYWHYTNTADTIHVEIVDHLPSSRLEVELLSTKVNTFMLLVQQTKQGGAVQELFLDLCKEWLSIRSVKESSLEARLLVNTTSVKHKRIATEKAYIQGKLIQSMLDQVPDNLIENSAQALDLVDKVLSAAVTQNMIDDGLIDVALSLLNIIVVSTNFQHSTHTSLITSVQSSLQRIAAAGIESSPTARNLSLLLECQELDVMQDTKPQVEDSVAEDKRTHKLAMSYLMSADSLPPVRAQGLDLLSQLIRCNSPVLDITATLVLLGSMLQDEEEYIYLRAVKAHVLLSDKHPKTVINGLIDSYVDADELHSLDTRLRIGETLLQVIEKAGQSFQGETANTVGEALLSIAGRRGYRAKADAQQQNSDALAQAKAAEFNDAWDGIDPNEDSVDNGVLAEIVDNWTGKRGVEDIRMRASSLSIFGSALEYNISGFSSIIVSNAIDLSVNILALEPQPEKAILRRSAILLIMSLIRALDTTSQNPGFGFAGKSLDDVIKILKYIVSVDNDGLVRQHATDVIEGLETWQMKSVLKMPYQPDIMQGGLRGLSINHAGRERPMIEEVLD